MDRLRTISVFVRAAELRSFARAAEELNLSPTMVGRHVQQLEARLDGRLIERTTRRHVLTDLGSAYLEHCQRILSELDEADACANALQAIPRGLVRVGAPLLFGTRSLVPALATFQRSYPEVEIDLKLSDEPIDHDAHKRDFVFGFGAVHDDRLVVRDLAPLRIILCASPAYLAGRTALVDPRQLRDHEVIHYGGSQQRGEWQLSSGSEAFSVEVNARLHINNCDAIRAAAAEHQGIARLAEVLVEENLRSGELVRVLPGFEAPALPLRLSYRPDHRAPAKLRKFVEFALASFGHRASSSGTVASLSSPRKLSVRNPARHAA